MAVMLFPENKKALFYPGQKPYYSPWTTWCHVIKERVMEIDCLPKLLIPREPQDMFVKSLFKQSLMYSVPSLHQIFL